MKRDRTLDVGDIFYEVGSYVFLTLAVARNVNRSGASVLIVLDDGGSTSTAGDPTLTSVEEKL